jgi:feruloyl-CoA synthase
MKSKSPSPQEFTASPSTAGNSLSTAVAVESVVARDLRDIPMRQLNRPPPCVEVHHESDGTTYVSCGYPFEPPDGLLIDCIGRAAAMRPDVTFLAERGPDRRWRRWTYAQALDDTAAVATWFIRNGFGPDGPPVMILSENSVRHALLMFGALRAGATVVPVSPSYSLDSDLGRLGHALDLIEPGLVYAQDPARYGPALERAAAPRRRLIRGDVDLARMLRDVDNGAVAARRDEINADTVAKILLTSGSTGQPKGAVNTHGNLIAATQMARQVGEPFDPARVHTVLDWLPWHHTYGGNANLNGVLRVAGTMYIDGGRPLPGRFDETIANLREISPTVFGCVPAAYAMLADALERDTELRRNFFKNLRGLSYGGALLPYALWERMQRLAAAELGERLPFGTGWGMTETTALGASVYWNVERSGLIGLPLPGSTLKLVPSGDRYEMRIKGPQIMARYHRNPGLNAEAFDDEGFFRTGDAVRWIDGAEPLSGLEFAGRLAEDFKLQSGTWVQAGNLRRDLLESLQPLAAELVIAAPDRPWLGALVWLAPGIAQSADVRAQLAARLEVFNQARKGGSTQVARLLLLKDPPSPSAGEITDKRSINMARVLERRAHDVETLYAEPRGPRVIVQPEL